MSSAPTMTACGLRSEKPGTVDDLARSGLERTPAAFSICPPRTQRNVATGFRSPNLDAKQRVRRTRARGPELQMPRNTESRNVYNGRERKKTLNDMLDIDRRRNRWLPINMRQLLYATGLRSRDEGVTHDVLAYLGGAEVLAETVSPGGGERKEHRDADDACGDAQKRREGAGPDVRRFRSTSFSRIAPVIQLTRNGYSLCGREPARAFWYARAGVQVAG